jgi:hypothetical protein
MPNRRELLGRVRLVDLLVVATVPAVLVVVYALPRVHKLQFALSYTDPTVLTAYTMHFVHLAEIHLVSNLLGYLLVVPLAYVFSVQSGRRRLFWVSFVTFLVAFPLVLSGLNVLLVRPRVGVGFSGINMAFVGLLTVTWTGFVGRRLVSTVSLADAPLGFFAGSAVIGTLAAAYSPLGVVVAVAAALAAVGYLLSLADDRGALRAVRRAMFHTGEFELAVWGLGVSLVLLIGAFPPDPYRDGAILNVFTHLLGYCLGFIVPYATACVLDWTDRRRQPAGGRPVRSRGTPGPADD